MPPVINDQNPTYPEQPLGPPSHDPSTAVPQQQPNYGGKGGYRGGYGQQQPMYGGWGNQQGYGNFRNQQGYGNQQYELQTNKGMAYPRDPNAPVRMPPLEDTTPTRGVGYQQPMYGGWGQQQQPGYGGKGGGYGRQQQPMINGQYGGYGQQQPSWGQQQPGYGGKGGGYGQQQPQQPSQSAYGGKGGGQQQQPSQSAYGGKGGGYTPPNNVATPEAAPAEPSNTPARGKGGT